MDLSPYPNLRKAEKLKSQSTLRILQKDFYSVYLIHQLCIQQIVEGCKCSLFLIASVFHQLKLPLQQNYNLSKYGISGTG